MEYADLGIAPPSIYKVILNEILPAKSARILDMPCGSGGLARYLTVEGAECVGMDIVPTYEHRPMIIADMNSPFPFADESFDIVISIEGIEHIHDAFHSLHECFRVLKSGGKLILSTPNIQNIRSRVKFLLRGTLYWFDPYEITRMGHVNVVPYFILKHILEAAGFREISVRANSKVLPHLPAIFCRFMQRFFSKSNVNDLEQNSPTIVNAENLIVSAKKPTN